MPWCSSKTSWETVSPIFLCDLSLIKSVSSRRFISISVTYFYQLEVNTSTFFREREKKTDRQRTLWIFFPSFLKFCHPTAALPFAFLLGTMSKGNIKSYPPLQPTESKKYAILISGERVWVIAYQEYLELQIKNLRMGKPSFSFLHAMLLKKKISDLWTVLVLEEGTSKIKSHDWRNNKRPFQKDLQRILAYIYSCCFFFFSKFCFLGKVVVQYLTEYFCMPAPYVLGKSRWHYVIYRKESGKVKNISGTYQVNKVCWS